MRRLIYATLITFFLGVACSKVENQKYFEYRLYFSPTKINSPSSSTHRYCCSQNESWVATLASNTIVWAEINSGEIVKTLMLPTTLGRVHDFQVHDTSSFVVYADSFIIHYNGEEYKYFDLNKLAKNFIVIPNYNIGFFDSLGLVSVFGIYDYEGVRAKESSYKFIGILNLKNDKFEVVDVEVPSQYKEYHLGSPQIFTSVNDKFLTISFEFSENVIVFDVVSKEIKNILLSSKLNFEENVRYNTKSKNKDGLDERKFRLIRNRKALFNPRTNELLRFYHPYMPINKPNGNYFSSMDRPTHLLSMNLDNLVVKEYILPSGVFYSGNLWALDIFRNHLVYNKRIENDTNKLSNTVISLELFDY